MSTGMTIDEMMEAAAKAAGVAIRRIENIDSVIFVDDAGSFWEPNINSWQSLELAATLRINVEHNHPSDNHAWVWAGIEGESEERMFLEDVPDESQRADRMRLAILRCAAAQAPKEGV